MPLESPLFLTKVECPICGTINEYETIRVGGYTEGDRETDFCPSVIKWRNPKYQRFHPLLFFTATCTHCYYTREFNNRFKEWKKDNNFRTYRLKAIKETHLSELASEHSFLKLIGEMLDNEEYPFETAVLKLLLAVYDELLYDHPSPLDLGRFYLRMAWLFRQYGGEDQQDVSRGTRLSKPMGDIERAVSDLRTWIAGLGRNIDYLEEAVDVYFGGQSGAESEPDVPGRETYTESLATLRDLNEMGRTVIGKMETALAANQPGSSEPGGFTGTGAFYDHDSFGDFLVGLSRIWDGVPVGEREALRLAVKYYIQAFAAGKEIAPGNQSIQASYLIGELSRRIGDHDTARQYFNTTIKTGQEYINEIRGDRTRTTLARKLLEMALKQGKKNLDQARTQ